MADKIPWKPERSHFQSFARRDKTPKTSSDNNYSDFSKPEPDIWNQRSLWILVGIFVTIGILWLANHTSNQGVSEDCFTVPDRGGITECN